MIRNQWYVILDAREVARGRVLGVRRMGRDLVVWRDAAGVVQCLADHCVHRGVALSAGKVKGDCVECPFHGLQYDGFGRVTVIPANGLHALVPATFRAETFVVREAHGYVYLWWGDARDQYPEVPFIPGLDDTKLTYATWRDPWHAFYSRAIENQLDVVHLPFVHYNTIGRGNRTLVNGPVTTLEGNVLRIWVFNEEDHGQTPLRSADIPTPEQPSQLTFVFPNLWQNNVGVGARITLAFVPIDDEHTMMYLRFYRSFGRMWPFRFLFDWLTGLANLVIARQDRRVVQTQRPYVSTLNGRERLLQGDLPIILYRRRREELQKEAGAQQA
jgi:phenylpropionate dioxygenase-like ring-hydroxylating dioxygenase large terminal subunit